ncbi:hypothetical protein [Bacillus velezensis]|uniref:hypothetical protein n=1 Tax=Bacillus velezensis TaxID=492670 RepID=UPI00320931F1
MIDDKVLVKRRNAAKLEMIVIEEYSKILGKSLISGDLEQADKAYARMQQASARLEDYKAEKREFLRMVQPVKYMSPATAQEFQRRFLVDAAY